MNEVRLTLVSTRTARDSACRDCLKRDIHAAMLALLAIALLLSACGGRVEDVSLTAVFPGADDFPGWTPNGEVEIFDRETIFQLVNGQAEAFFAYGFEQVAVRSYENAEGIRLDIHIWQLATPSDAYGLFTVNSAGEPADIGSDGDADKGRRLAFWQDHYVVWIRARQSLEDAELWRFAEALSKELPAGGDRPTLIDRLPPEGLVDRSAVFFHEELSIQDELWLGGENLLGLGPETDGVLAQYEFGDGTARLLLMQYPIAEGATAGMEALAESQMDGPVIADVRNKVLGAVFGEIDEATAKNLLGEALGHD